MINVTSLSLSLSLSLLQNAWRVLILDTAKKQISIKKHRGLENLPASVSTKITQMTQEHLLQGEGKMRRGLPVSGTANDAASRIKVQIMTQMLILTQRQKHKY
jgi:hypothetical protein